jgi:hypothetical protein
MSALSAGVRRLVAPLLKLIAATRDLRLVVAARDRYVPGVFTSNSML